MLFFGARTREELPYFGPLQSLPKDFIDINFAFSRTPGQPKKYVQDLIHERAVDLVPLLSDPNSHFYVCGLKAMEEGVVLALARCRRRRRSRLGRHDRPGAEARRAPAPRDLLRRAIATKKNAAGAASSSGTPRERRRPGDREAVLLDRLPSPLPSTAVPWALALGLVRLGLGLVLGLRRLAADGGLGVFACLAWRSRTVALPASLAAVVAWAWAPAAPIRKAMAMSAFFMVSFIGMGGRETSRCGSDRSGIVRMARRSIARLRHPPTRRGPVFVDPTRSAESPPT